MYNIIMTNNRQKVSYVIFALSMLSFSVPNLIEVLFEVDKIVSISVGAIFLGMALGWLFCYLVFKNKIDN
jgi:sulfite exporter TauE/SafE